MQYFVVRNNKIHVKQKNIKFIKHVKDFGDLHGKKRTLPLISINNHAKTEEIVYRNRNRPNHIIFPMYSI